MFNELLQLMWNLLLVGFAFSKPADPIHIKIPDLDHNIHRKMTIDPANAMIFYASNFTSSIIVTVGTEACKLFSETSLCVFSNLKDPTQIATITCHSHKCDVDIVVRNPKLTALSDKGSLPNYFSVEVKASTILRLTATERDSDQPATDFADQAQIQCDQDVEILGDSEQVEVRFKAAGTYLLHIGTLPDTRITYELQSEEKDGQVGTLKLGVQNNLVIEGEKQYKVSLDPSKSYVYFTMAPESFAERQRAVVLTIEGVLDSAPVSFKKGEITFQKSLMIPTLKQSELTLSISTQLQTELVFLIEQSNSMTVLFRDTLYTAISGNYTIAYDQHEKMEVKNTLTLRVGCTSFRKKTLHKGEATILPADCTYGQKGCMIVMNVPAQFFCGVYVDMVQQQEVQNDLVLSKLQGQQTKKFVRGDKYYFVHRPVEGEGEGEGKVIRVGQSDVIVRLTFNKSCLPVKQKCMEYTGTKHSPIEVEQEDEQSWYIEVQSFKNQYVDIQLSNAAPNSAQPLTLNHQHYSSVDGFEQRQFVLTKVDSLKGVEEIEVKVISPASTLQLIVVSMFSSSTTKKKKVKAETQTEGSLSGRVVVPIKGVSSIAVIVRSRQKVKGKQKHVQFSVLASTFDNFIFLSSGQPVTELIPANGQKEFVMVVDPEQQDLKLRLSLPYGALKTPLVGRVYRDEQSQKNLTTFTLTNNLYVTLPRKQLRLICSKNKLSSQTDFEAQSQNFCHLILSIRSGLDYPVSVYMMVVDDQAIVMLKDGAWTYSVVSKVQDFALPIYNLEKSITLYAYSNSGKHSFGQFIYSRDLNLPESDWVFPEPKQYAVDLHSYSASFSMFDLKAKCQDDQQCYLLISVSFNDEDNESANNAVREIAMMVSTGAMSMLPGEQVNLDLKKDQQKMLTFSLQPLLANPKAKGLELLVQPLSGQLMFLCSISGPKHPTLPNKDHFQFVLEETTVIDRKQLLSYMKESQLEEGDEAELIVNAVAYKHSQGVIRISYAEGYTLVSENTPASFAIDQGEEQIFAYQQVVAAPFSIKLQQNTGEFEFSMVPCRNRLGDCYESIAKADSYVALKNSEKIKMDQSNPLYCGTPCVYVVRVKSNKGHAEGSIHIHPQSGFVSLIQNVPFSDFLEAGEVSSYSVAALRGKSISLTINFHSQNPKFQPAPGNAMSRNVSLSSNSAFYQLLATTTGSFAYFALTCVGPCSYVLLYQSTQSVVYMVPGVMLSIPLSSGQESATLIAEYSSNQFLDLYMNDVKDFNRLKITKSTFKTGKDYPEKQMQLSVDHNHVRSGSPTVRVELLGGFRYEVLIELTQEATLTLNAAVSRQGMNILHEGTVYPGSLALGQQANYLLDIGSQDVYAEVEIRSCSLANATVQVASSYERFQAGDFLVKQTIGQASLFKQSFRVKDDQLYIKVSAGLKPSHYSVSYKLFDSKAETSKELVAGGGGNLLLQVVNSQDIIVSFQPIKTKEEVQYQLLAGDKFEVVFSQAHCPSLFFDDLRTEGVRPRALKTALKDSQLQANVFLKGGERILTVRAVTSSGLTAVYKVVQLGSSSSLVWSFLSLWWVWLILGCACYLREKFQDHKGYRGLQLDDF